MSNKFQKFAQHNLCERKVESLRRKLHLSQDEKQCNDKIDAIQGKTRQDKETTSMTINDEVGRSLDCAKRFQKLKSMRKRTEEKIQKNTVSSYIPNDETHSNAQNARSITPLRRREQLERIKSCQKSKGVHVRNQNTIPKLDGHHVIRMENNSSNHCNDKNLRQKTLKQALALKMIEEAMTIETQIKKMKEKKQQEHVNAMKHEKSEIAMNIISKHSRNDRNHYFSEREMEDLMISHNDKHRRFSSSPNYYTVNDRVWINSSGDRMYMDEIQRTYDDGYSVQSSVFLNPVASIDRATHRFEYENKDRSFHTQQIYPNESSYYQSRSLTYDDELYHEYRPYRENDLSEYDSNTYYSDPDSFFSNR